MSYLLRGCDFLHGRVVVREPHVEEALETLKWGRSPAFADGPFGRNPEKRLNMLLEARLSDACLTIRPTTYEGRRTHLPFMSAHEIADTYMAPLLGLWRIAEGEVCYTTEQTSSPGGPRRHWRLALDGRGARVAEADLTCARPLGAGGVPQLALPMAELSFGATEDEGERDLLEGLWERAFRAHLPGVRLERPRDRSAVRALAEAAQVRPLVAAWASGVPLADVLATMPHDAL